MSMSATYSPDDNKLRLYSLSRLGKEDYNRVKAAGFRWAPKQELFVAPMWTPSREDLLLELCGEIGDEDTSLVDRAEQRSERFEDYSDKRTADAESARKAVAAIADNIPFGQPILVGHHSEKHARKDAQRIENGMRKAVKMWETAGYWKDRAAGAIRHAKHHELPGVRHRRIKTLESEKRKVERTIADLEARLKLWTGLDKFTGNDREEMALRVANMEHSPVKLADGSEYYSAWGALSDGKITASEVRAQRLERIPPAIARQGRWIAHYENRIAYESAMLNEQLGAEDGTGMAGRFDFKVGGKVLVERGEWLVILRVNKANGAVNSLTCTPPSAVTWTKSWKYGVEKVQDYKAPTEAMAAAVKKVNTLPPLCNYPGEGFREMTKAEWDARHKWSDFPYVGVAAKTEARGAHRFRQIQKGNGKMWERDQVFITDQKRVDPPAPETKPAPVVVKSEPDAAARIADMQERQQDDAGEQRLNDGVFRAMKETLKAGVKVAAVNQLFPTPPDIAAQAVELADIKPGHRILEPSAGTGNLALAMPGDTVRWLVEINQSLADRLTQFGEVICADFMELECNETTGTFDRIVMNPPFQNGDDVKHIKHAMSFLKPGGRLVAICANGPRQQEQLKPLASEWIDLPTGSFKEQGTGVNTAMLVIDKQPGEWVDWPETEEAAS